LIQKKRELLKGVHALFFFGSAKSPGYCMKSLKDRFPDYHLPEDPARFHSIEKKP